MSQISPFNKEKTCKSCEQKTFQKRRHPQGLKQNTMAMVIPVIVTPSTFPLLFYLAVLLNLNLIISKKGKFVKSPLVLKLLLRDQHINQCMKLSLGYFLIPNIHGVSACDSMCDRAKFGCISGIPLFIDLRSTF